MGRYNHDFEPGGGERKTPLAPHKRIALAYFILAGLALAAGVLLPMLIWIR